MDEDITLLLQRFQDNDANAQSALISAIYGELRAMAGRYMSRERPGHSLQATALLNEAYLKLAKIRSVQWKDRTHFFAVAARVMRHILVDHARKRLVGDAGQKIDLLPFEDELALPQDDAHSWMILEVDRALQKLSTVDKRAEQVIELRFFGGLSVPETAEALQIAPRSVERDWTFGKAWLRDQLKAGKPDGNHAVE